MPNKHLSPKIEVETKNCVRKQEVEIMCAWCGKKMGKKDGKGMRGISHSLCKECLARLLAKEESKSTTGSEQDGKCAFPKQVKKMK